MQGKNKEYITLVDMNDQQIGTEEKIKAHKEGKLHRAFSIFIFNSKGKLLIQKRANSKYHSGGYGLMLFVAIRDLKNLYGKLFIED